MWPGASATFKLFINLAASPTSEEKWSNKVKASSE